jgi:hypothetical protein
MKSCGQLIAIGQCNGPASIDAGPSSFFIISDASLVKSIVQTLTVQPERRNVMSRQYLQNKPLTAYLIRQLINSLSTVMKTDTISPFNERY